MASRIYLINKLCFRSQYHLRQYAVQKRIPTRAKTFMDIQYGAIGLLITNKNFALSKTKSEMGVEPSSL